MFGGQLKLRLRPAEIQAIRALADPEGYSAQAWIVRQLRHRLEDAVPFAQGELDALRDAIRELAAIGRNLNSLLHVLHRSDRFEEGRLDLQTLHTGRSVTKDYHRHHDPRHASGLPWRELILKTIRCWGRRGWSFKLGFKESNKSRAPRVCAERCVSQALR